MFMRIFILSFFAIHFAIIKPPDQFLSYSGETIANMKKDKKMLYPLPVNDQTNTSTFMDSFQQGDDYKSENIIPQKVERKHTKSKIKMMKKLMKMIKQLKKDGKYNKRDTGVEVEELSALKQKKRLYSQENGTIFSTKFRLQNGIQSFTLRNGKTKIHKGNSRFGNLAGTDNIKKSKPNIFIPYSILNPEKINKSFTLILTYIKPKNPFSKSKPEVNVLFDSHEYVLWKIPIEYQHKRASYHLQISVNGGLSWTELPVLNSNDVEKGLVKFDVTEYAKNKNFSAIGRLFLKTNNVIFESDIFKLKQITEKGTLTSKDKVEDDTKTFTNDEEDRAAKDDTEATTTNRKDIVINSNNENFTEASIHNIIKEIEKAIEIPTNKEKDTSTRSNYENVRHRHSDNNKGNNLDADLDADIIQ